MRRLTSGFCSHASGPASKALALVVAMAATAACGDDSSTTDLNPAGPPMIRQVFMREKITVVDGETTTTRIKNAVAFGSHPNLPIDDFGEDNGTVTTAVARGDQAIRIVLDELVRGNSLEEIACADGTYGKVPDGATPDDVSACTGVDLSRCKNLCIGPDGPLGVLDVDDNGSADAFRFIDYGTGDYGVNLVCAGQNMPLLVEGDVRSFYNPSGNQLIPAGEAGHNGLGPALILIPAQGMRTGTECSLAFHDEVTDRDGNRICAPPGGDIAAPCASDGDTALVKFTVEPLGLATSSPLAGAVDVDPTTVPILFFNAAVDPASLGAITLSDGADVAIEAAASVDDPVRVDITVTGGLQPNTEYTFTFGTGLADVFGGTVPAAATMSFTTGAGTPGTPDAGVPDAAL